MKDVSRASDIINRIVSLFKKRFHSGNWLT